MKIKPPGFGGFFMQSKSKYISQTIALKYFILFYDNRTNYYSTLIYLQII